MTASFQKADFSGRLSTALDYKPLRYDLVRTSKTGKGQMARIFREPIKSEDGKQNLIARSVVVVEVVSFTFRFTDVAQLQKCIAYYKTKTHPSSLVSDGDLAADFGKDWREQRGGKLNGGSSVYLCICWKNQSVRRSLKLSLKLWSSSNLASSSNRCDHRCS